jgi:hypothetical protein
MIAGSTVDMVLPPRNALTSSEIIQTSSVRVYWQKYDFDIE